MLICASVPDPTLTSAERDPRWAAVVSRDAGADGDFFYSVETTGVYCRPSCASRAARPANVRFHATAAEAQAAGYRACKRCKPDEPPLPERQSALVAQACRAIEAAETPPSLTELARAANLSPHHFHRLFKAVAGLTPRAYAEAERARRLRGGLEEGRAVTEAIYAAGFNSSGRFYEQADAILGMSPSGYRAGGAGLEVRYAVGQSALGAVLAAQSERGVCAILLGDDPATLERDLAARFAKAILVRGDAAFAATLAKVIALVEAPETGLDLPLDVRGTAFQQRVWRALQAIPPGQTASYAQVAAQIGTPKAVRAVAGACAANPLAVAIPCHRVVKSDGGLSGYRWGVARKRALLARESGRG